MPTFHLEDVLYGLQGFPNGVQDLADYVAVLVTLKADRDQRNRRRQNRRNAQIDRDGSADGSISEDEDSGALTPIIDSFKELASVETFEAQESDDHVQPRRKNTEKSQQAFSDQEALQRTTQIMQDDSFPSAIFDLALNQRSPPLTLFTHEALTRIRYGENIEYPKCPTNEKPNLRLLKTEPFGNEEKIDATQFLLVYPTFLRFLSSLLKDKATLQYQGFCEHYDKIASQQDFTQNFDAYRTFDRNIRRDFFHSSSGFIIDTNSVEWATRLLNAKSLMYSFPVSQTSATHYNQSRPSFRERPQPYPSQNQSFRFANSTRVSALCLRCGNQGHRANMCQESSPSRPGRNWIVKIINGILCCISDNKPICINFNLDKGCSNHSAFHHSNVAHCCSLCADSSHGASRCTRN